MSGIPATSRRPGVSRMADDLNKKKDTAYRAPATARTKRPEPVVSEIDPMAESIRLRKESSKLFGYEFEEEPKSEIKWLDDLEEKEKLLMMNVKAGRLYDDSILNIFEEGSSRVVQKDGDDPFDVAMQMLDAGFEAIHKQSMAEKKLLDERARLLEQIRAELMIDRTAEYTSHEK